VFRELLVARTGSFCKLSSDQLGQLESHYELMLRWNKVINLTRIVREEEVVDLHYAESMFLASLLPPGPLKIADIGSGAGFPGYPVAVLRAECSVALVESNQRKAVFLKEVSRPLDNVRVVASRAEDLTENFDWVISRAVNSNDLQQIGFRLAPNLALLCTGVNEQASRTVPIPWAANRSVGFVSRETRT
jgi:16S rRNA (guanine(527)-N(7))-methyltransferase RsmG